MKETKIQRQDDDAIAQSANNQSVCTTERFGPKRFGWPFCHCFYASIGRSRHRNRFSAVIARGFAVLCGSDGSMAGARDHHHHGREWGCLYHGKICALSISAPIWSGRVLYMAAWYSYIWQNMTQASSGGAACQFEAACSLVQWLRGNYRIQGGSSRRVLPVGRNIDSKFVASREGVGIPRTNAPFSALASPENGGRQFSRHHPIVSLCSSIRLFRESHCAW